MVNYYKDTKGNQYTENDVIKVTMKPSCSHGGHNSSGYSTHYWLNRCPTCGQKNVLYNNIKHVAEGEITMRHGANHTVSGNHDDLDFCGVCGKEKVTGNTYKQLTEVFPITGGDSGGQYDTSRPVYMCCDVVATSSLDKLFRDRVKKQLKEMGFTVKCDLYGPSTMSSMGYKNMKGVSHATGLILCGGIDPQIIRMYAKNDIKWDNTLYALRHRDNDLVIIGWGPCCDWVHPGGGCYKKIPRPHDDSRPGKIRDPLYNGMEYCTKNEIKCDCINGDYKTEKQILALADKVAKSYASFYKKSGSDPTPTPSTDKTISQVITEKVYTVAYYNTQLTSKTDTNGTFTHKLTLPYNGRYKINYYYSGSRNYAPSTKTIHADFYGGANFTEKLLMSKTSTTYTDNTNTTTSTGSIGGEKHYKTVTTTQKYKNGKPDGKPTTVTIYSDNQSSTSSQSSSSTSDNNSNTPSTEKNDFNKETAITLNIPAVNGKPNISKMGSDYKWVDNNGTYTLASTEIQRVAKLDNYCQQIYGFVPKYTFFRDYNSNTKYVCTREKWNVIIRAYNKYQVNKGFKESNPPWGLKISLKGRNRYYPIYYDHQEYIDGSSYTCGPTSMSMISQYLNNYYSERKLATIYGTTRANGTDEDKINSRSPQAHMMVEDIQDKESSVREALQKGYGVLWHISGHYMCIVSYNSSNNTYLCLNPSGPSHRIPAHNWLTWSQIMNTDRKLKDNGFQRVRPTNSISDTWKKYVGYYYNNMAGKYTVSSNNENTSTEDPVTYITTAPNNGKKSSTVTPNKSAKDPFTNNIPCLNKNGKSVPDIANWKRSGYSFTMADENGTYTLTKEQFREVMVRDAKTMQLHQMYMTPYVMFRTQDEPKIYHILRREKWNCIEKAINYYMVYSKSSSSSNDDYPSTFKINLGGQNKWCGQTINLKGKEYNYWFVVDQQNNILSYNGSCGPTSASMMTQYLHDYYSENWFVKKVNSGMHERDYARATPHGSPHICSSANDRESLLKQRVPVMIYIPNHYSCVFDISDDYSKGLVFNPSHNYSINAGWQTLSYIRGRCQRSGASLTPNWSINESEKSQIGYLFNNLGGRWIRKLNYKEWQMARQSLGACRIWDKS